MALGVLALFFITTVTALGVSPSYWKENPLKMYPGQSREVTLTLLQSSEEKSSAEVQVSLIEGSEIAKIKSGKDYTVESGSKEEIILEITIPNDAGQGETYNVKLAISPKPDESGQGNIQLGIIYNEEFPVIITDKSGMSQVEAKKSSNSIVTIVIIIGILILLSVFVITYVLLKRKDN